MRIGANRSGPEPGAFSRPSWGRFGLEKAPTPRFPDLEKNLKTLLTALEQVYRGSGSTQILGIRCAAPLWMAIKSKNVSRIKNRHFGGLGGPRGPGDPAKGGGRSPPPFGRVSGAPGAARTPQMTPSTKLTMKPNPKSSNHLPGRPSGR